MKWPSKLLWGIPVVIAAALFLYKYVDLAISLDYARQEEQIQSGRVAFLEGLLKETGTKLTRAQIDDLSKAYEGGKDHFVKRGVDQVEIDGVTFRFNGNAVVAVTFGER